jgi:hypothetical protein
MLKALKIPPAPQRRTDTTWRQFLHGAGSHDTRHRFIPRGLRSDPPAAVLPVRDRGRPPLRAHSRCHRLPGRSLDPCSRSATC